MSSAVERRVTRRHFIRGASGIVVGAMGVGSVSNLLGVGESAFTIPDSAGYILVDDKMCGECKTCMAACSLFNEGEINLSLSRIQIIADPMNTRFGIEQCRHCVNAPCVEVCPVGANAPDPTNLNAREVDRNKCMGCRRCQQACPYTFARLQFNSIDQKMRKCNLCDGDPQCAKQCPNGAVKFIKNEYVPYQLGDAGYKVNLRRNYPWAKLKWAV